MISEELLRACLGEHWELHRVRIEPHHGGMNSATWFVTAGSRRWVAKAVAPDTVLHFTGGLAAAALLDRPDLPTGAPERSRDGQLAVTVDGYMLALLAWVPGDGITTDRPAAQHIIGTTLARAHALLRDADLPSTGSFHWVDPGAEHLDVQAWVRPAVTAALAALDDLDSATLTWGPLHTDPAPEAFRLDPDTGTCGLIDWSTAMRGPYLYDLASAVMYVGGPDNGGPLIEAYLAEGVLPRAEVDRGLLTFLRFRWAVQADYFARRIANHDLTGIADQAENEKGLEDARRRLTRAVR
jgi:homoserine kinase type II